MKIYSLAMVTLLLAAVWTESWGKSCKYQHGVLTHVLLQVWGWGWGNRFSPCFCCGLKVPRGQHWLGRCLLITLVPGDFLSERNIGANLQSWRHGRDPHSGGSGWGQAWNSTNPFLLSVRSSYSSCCYKNMFIQREINTSLIRSYRETPPNCSRRAIM